MYSKVSAIRRQSKVKNGATEHAPTMTEFLQRTLDGTAKLGAHHQTITLGIQMFGWRTLEGYISEDKDLQNQMNRRDMKGKEVTKPVVLYKGNDK